MLYSNMHDLLYHLVNYDHNDNHNERYELHIGVTICHDHYKTSSLSNVQ